MANTDTQSSRIRGILVMDWGSAGSVPTGEFESDMFCSNSVKSGVHPSASRRFAHSGLTRAKPHWLPAIAAASQLRERFFGKASMVPRQSGEPQRQRYCSRSFLV